MYYRPRVIPCLTLINRGLVKTTKFASPRYIGDPINTIKIFNEKGVDEICILDIRATLDGLEPDYDLLKDLAGEAFIPLSYGGGITNIGQIEEILHIGFEKVIINTTFYKNPSIVKEASSFAGSQSVVVSIDVRNEKFGRKICYIEDGSKKIKESAVELAVKAEQFGAGEILLTSMSQDGTMLGYDTELVKQVSSAVGIPVVAAGGAGNTIDLKKAVDSGAHAAAAGSMFIYYGKQKAVLISMPEEKELFEIGLYRN